MSTINSNHRLGSTTQDTFTPCLTSSTKSRSVWTAAQIARSAYLPTLPDVASQLLGFAQQEDPDYNEMSKVIRCDPAISGKLLTTVNSALFGFRTRTESIERALPKLGTSMVRTLILGFHLGSYQPEHAIVAQVLPKLWQNFLTQAVIAEMLAESAGLDGAKCFLGGMIQDIGILALVSECPREYVQHILHRNTLPNVLTAEQNYFGFNHVDVTREITRNWNIGDEFNDALLHHHDRVAESGGSRNPDKLFRAVLQAAHMGACCLLSSDSESMPDSCQLANWQAFLGDHFDLELSDSLEILNDVGARVEETSVVFGVQAGKRIDSGRIARVAATLLQKIAIESQIKANSAEPNTDELHRDYLSGLLNRRFLSEVLASKMEEWIRKRKSFAMVFIDVDGFKQVNDSYGHKTGDQMIQHIASWLESATRPSDYVLRLGGDEYLIAAQIKHSFCQKMCNRLVKEAPPLKADDLSEIPVSLSIGCVFYKPSRNDTVAPNWIIDQADQLMYHVKRGGGCNVKILNLDGKTRH